MKINQVHLTKGNISELIKHNDIYILSGKTKNEGRLSFSRLKNVDFEGLMKSINRGDEKIAFYLSKEDK